jgi:methylated-DNA-[protein]-cysteine S-methyltransferase
MTTTQAVPTTRAHLVMDSPIGPLTLVADGAALACVYMSDHRHAPADDTFGPADPPPGPQADVLGQAERQLTEYFAGTRTEFDLPLAMPGTDFQQQVWAGLRQIPYGETISYGELARRLGKPNASRAVGLANGRNPVSIIVPCHRVVGSTGRLTGYGGGLDRKARLLDLERETLAHTEQLTLCHGQE